MRSAKWTWFTIAYQCAFAYVIALIFNQFGNLFSGNLVGALNIIAFIISIFMLLGLIFMLIRPDIIIKNKTKSINKESKDV